MANKAKHAFGALERVDSAIQSGKVDAYDILFMKDENGKPYVGWIDKDGKKVIVDDSAEFATLEAEIANKADSEDVEAEVKALETQIEEKVNAETVQAMIETYSKAVVEVVEF
jgi:hypothetical protein